MESDLGRAEASLDLSSCPSFYLVIVLFCITHLQKCNGQLFCLLIVFAAFTMISAYYMAINRLQPAKATGLNVSYVVWTVLFAAMFWGTPLTVLTIINFICCNGCVYIIIKE